MTLTNLHLMKPMNKKHKLNMAYIRYGYTMIQMLDYKGIKGYSYQREHRIVMEKHLGRYLSDDEHVHHKDGNKSNNVLDNLELTDLKSHRVIHSDSLRQHAYKKKSNYMGVYYAKNKSKPWRASLMVNKIKHQTPSFETEVEAAKAYDVLVINFLPNGKRNFQEDEN